MCYFDIKEIKRPHVSIARPAVQTATVATQVSDEEFAKALGIQKKASVLRQAS